MNAAASALQRPPNVEAKDNKSAPMGTSELWVHAFLGPAGLSQGSASSAAMTATGHTGSSEWRHLRRVNHKLGATPQQSLAMTSMRRSTDVHQVWRYRGSGLGRGRWWQL